MAPKAAIYLIFIKRIKMKTIKRLFVIAIALTITSFAHAQNYNYKLDGPSTATKTFTVNGVCEMCKHRIENAVVKLPGVWSAGWNIDSKILLVKYDKLKTNPDKIAQQVIAAGHDTDKLKAGDMVYEELPGCCHYQRRS
jgi:copper chaperone CopZ